MLSSCSNGSDEKIEIIEINSSGPIIVEKKWLPFPLNKDISISFDPQIEFSKDFYDGNLIIYPADALDIRNKYHIEITNDTSSFSVGMVIQEPCLLFLGNITGKQEIWKFCNGKSHPISQTGGKVIEFAASTNGEWIAYSQMNEKGEVEIWLMEADGREEQKFFHVVITHVRISQLIDLGKPSRLLPIEMTANWF
jgi:hypothetical protein